MQRIALPEYTNQIWHGFCPGIIPEHLMDIVFMALTSRITVIDLIRTRLLLDPYAVAYIGELTWDPALFGYTMESVDDLTFDERDSAPFVPKCRGRSEIRLGGLLGAPEEEAKATGCPSTTRSFMKCMCVAIPRNIQPCPEACVEPIAGLGPTGRAGLHQVSRRDVD